MITRLSSAIADLRRGASPEEINREVKTMLLGRVNRFLVRWAFDQMLLKSTYSVDKMKKMLSQTPFRKCKIDVGNVGFQVLLEK